MTSYQKLLKSLETTLELSSNLVISQVSKLNISSNQIYLPILGVVSYVSFIYIKNAIVKQLDPYIIQNATYDIPRAEHDRKRQATYPDLIFNAWYHICDSKDLKIGEVKEIRALGRTFVVWRTSDGTPVCQDAFCIHLG